MPLARPRSRPSPVCTPLSKTNQTLSVPLAVAGSDTVTPIYAKKMLVSWGIQQGASSADVFLQTTDETGKQVSHPLGPFPGQCATVTPAEDMDAIIVVDCKDGATGTQLQVVHRDPDVIVLKLRIDDGVTPDPMAREELMRVKVPAGASVSAG